MSKSKIVGTGPIDETAQEILAPFGDYVQTPDFRKDTLIGMLGGAVGLVVRGEGAASAEVINAGKELKVIARSGVGYNNVDIAAATMRKIPVVYTPGAGARAVAEASMTLMLGLCKRLTYWDQQLKAGNWKCRDTIQTGDLEGASLGIVGFGRIGQILAALARPFEMRLLAYDPFILADVGQEHGAQMVELGELLEQSDFICLHAALTDQNQGLINESNLRRVKRGAYLINMARGGLVESLDVLRDALKDGRLAGVGLDVFQPEPPDTNHALFGMPNVLTTPHSLAMSRRAMARIFRQMAEDMVAVLTGGRPQAVVNPEVLA